MIQTLASFAVKLFGAALSFGLSLLIARLYGAAGTGFFALALTTTVIVSVISLVGLDSLLLRSVSRDIQLGKISEVHGQVRAATFAVLVISVVAAVLLGIVAVFPPDLISTSNLDARILGLAGLAVVPFALSRIAMGAIRGAGRVVTAQWIGGPLSMFTTFTAVLLLSLLGFEANTNVEGASSAFQIHIISLFITAGIGLLIVRSVTQKWPAPTRVPPASMIKVSWRLSLIALSMWVSDWLLLLIINEQASAADVGQYRIAWQIMFLVTMIIDTFEVVAGPKISAAYSINDIDRIRRIYSQSVKGMLALSAPLFVVIFLFPGWLLSFFGSEFINASTALRILAFGQLINIASGPLGAIIIMTGNERASLRMSAWSLALIAALGIMLIPAYGIVGAAITSTVNIIFRRIYSVVTVRRTVFNPARQL